MKLNAITRDLYHHVSDLTEVELRIKKAYCNDVLSSLDALNSGDSIKKGNLIICANFTNFFSQKYEKYAIRRLSFLQKFTITSRLFERISWRWDKMHTWLPGYFNKLSSLWAIRVRECFKHPNISGLVLYELYRTNLELLKRQTARNDEQAHQQMKVR